MKIQKIRYEHFGGIIGTEDPVYLLWVDRDYLMSRGFNGRAVWERRNTGFLLAPVEMEIVVTSRCNYECPCCYMNAGPCGEDVSEQQILKALKVASEMDVFHVAFGGGEPLLHPRLLFLADKAREMNLLPTLSTNGSLVSARWAREAKKYFVRVNVSLDLTGGIRDVRLRSDVPLKAVKILRDEGIEVGINFIVTSGNVYQLGEVFKMAAQAGADSVLILRPKPSGRGARLYRSVCLSSKQQLDLISTLLRVSAEYNISFHLDCAFAPLLMGGGVSSKALELLGAYGCIAGHLLITVDMEGMVHPCSHLNVVIGSVEELSESWRNSQVLNGFRTRVLRMNGKCTACAFTELCRGGCAVINQYYSRELEEPDSDIACQLLERNAFEVPSSIGKEV